MERLETYTNNNGQRELILAALVCDCCEHPYLNLNLLINPYVEMRLDVTMIIESLSPENKAHLEMTRTKHANFIILNRIQLPNSEFSEEHESYDFSANNLPGVALAIGESIV